MGRTTKFLNAVRSGMSKNGSHILFGMGIAGAIGTVVMAVKATPKALTILDEELDMHGLTCPIEKIPEHLTVRDKARLTWKCYIPTAVSGALSIACLVCSHTIDTKRNAALATVCALTEATLKEYQNKVVEVVGEKQERVVRDAIAQDQIQKNPVQNNEVVITKKGDMLCYDPISGRYFKSDYEQIRRAMNELNIRLNQEMYVSLNDLYDELGLKNVGIGYELGWNVARGLVDFCLTSTLAEDGTPCLVIGHHNAPTYNYSKFG